MVVGRGYAQAGGERGRLRAADTDRESVAGFLKTAYSEGRLSKDELDSRLESALSARTYADLDELLTDLPVASGTTMPTTGSTPVSRVATTNGLAVASLVFGLGQVMIGPLATVPAIVLGHAARRQIKRTGEQGAGLALAGLVLGWAVAILCVLLLIVAVAMIARTQAAVPGTGMPGMKPMP